ncbi:MAG TPA: SMI1/KNR4 family protein, partial [Ktedonobacterales bacterium]|nr:SMI1/KNR4 family protein [Ktedonobacterales bacterium]
MDRWREMIEDTQTRYNLLSMRMRARATYVVGEESLLRPLDSATQLHGFERQLGFSLPPMLCHLYLTVSNGAEFFKPGNWMYGVPDEWYAQNPNAPTISSYQGFGKRLDLVTEHALETHPGAFAVLKDFPPEGTVSIADLGGGERIWLDGLTGKLWADSEYYDENHEFGGFAYSFFAPSVEIWLERKLAAPPNQESAGLYHRPYPLTQIMRAGGEISEAAIPPAVSPDNLAHEAYARLRLGKQRGE